MPTTYCPHFGKVFTVRGMCATCAPDVHASYQRAYDAIMEMTARFRSETGVGALEDWHAFEAFVDRQADKAEYFLALQRDSTREVH